MLKSILLVRISPEFRVFLMQFDILLQHGRSIFGILYPASSFYFLNTAEDSLKKNLPGNSSQMCETTVLKRQSSGNFWPSWLGFDILIAHRFSPFEALGPRPFREIMNNILQTWDRWVEWDKMLKISVWMCPSPEKSSKNGKICLNLIILCSERV